MSQEHKRFFGALLAILPWVVIIPYLLGGPAVIQLGPFGNFLGMSYLQGYAADAVYIIPALLLMYFGARLANEGNRKKDENKT